MERGGGTLKKCVRTPASTMQPASAEFRQYFWKRVMHAARTRPMEEAFMPTSIVRTHAYAYWRAASQKGIDA